jgi:hypothetical protein
MPRRQLLADLVIPEEPLREPTDDEVLAAFTLKTSPYDRRTSYWEGVFGCLFKVTIVQRTDWNGKYLGVWAKFQSTIPGLSNGGYLRQVQIDDVAWPTARSRRALRLALFRPALAAFGALARIYGPRLQSEYGMTGRERGGRRA